MELNTERDGSTLIAKAGGRVDGTNASEFQDALKSAIEANDEAVILNFEELSYISSAGLRVILLTAKDMRTANVKFAVCSLSQPVARSIHHQRVRPDYRHPRRPERRSSRGHGLTRPFAA